MTNNYKSAINKIQPSDKWRSETLEKMLTAQQSKPALAKSAGDGLSKLGAMPQNGASLNTEPSTTDSAISSRSKSGQPEAGDNATKLNTADNGPGRKLFLSRYKPLLAAAVFVLIALPVLHLNFFNTGIDSATAETTAEMPSAINEAAPETAYEEEAAPEMYAYSAEGESAQAYDGTMQDSAMEVDPEDAAPKIDATTTQNADDDTMASAGGQPQEFIEFYGVVVALTDTTITVEDENGDEVVCAIDNMTTINIDGEIAGASAVIYAAKNTETNDIPMAISIDFYAE